MDSTHPFCISISQVIIDCNNMNPLALKCIQVCRECRHKCLTFTGFHLCNTALMQDHTTDQLYSVMTHAKNTGCRFSDNRVSFHQKIIQCLALGQTFLELVCLCPQLFIR